MTDEQYFLIKNSEIRDYSWITGCNSYKVRERLERDIRSRQISIEEILAKVKECTKEVEDIDIAPTAFNAGSKAIKLLGELEDKLQDLLQKKEETPKSEEPE